MRIHVDLNNLLGQGCYGSVFAAEILGRKVAAKKCSTNVRLHEEAHLLALCRHLHVVNTYGIAKFNEEPYLIMELAAGGTLGSLLGIGLFSMLEKKLLVRQICSGLEHIHLMQVVHRDIQMGNLLMRSLSPLHVLISDFGESRYYHHSKLIDNYHDIVADQPYSYKSDIFLLALVTCQLLEDRTEYVTQVERLNPFAPPTEPVSESVRQAITLSLDPNPAKRLTAAEFGYAFR